MPLQRGRIRAGNKGLTVTVNLWALARYQSDFTAEMARLWIKGTVTDPDRQRRSKFNDAGELITILGRWNREQLRSLRKAS